MAGRPSAELAEVRKITTFKKKNAIFKEQPLNMNMDGIVIYVMLKTRKNILEVEKNQSMKLHTFEYYLSIHMKY